MNVSDFNRWIFCKEFSDLNDPNIISYKKKNLSGNREKSEDSENMTFDFEIDQELKAPEAPERVYGI